MLAMFRTCESLEVQIFSEVVRLEWSLMKLRREHGKLWKYFVMMMQQRTLFPPFDNPPRDGKLLLNLSVNKTPFYECPVRCLSKNRRKKVKRSRANDNKSPNRTHRQVEM